MRQDKNLSDSRVNIENVNINIQINVNSNGSTQKITSSRNKKENKKKSCFWKRFKEMLVKFVTEIDVNIIIVLTEMIFTLIK